jgi:AraC-like DNA-binding protein
MTGSPGPSAAYHRSSPVSGAERGLVVVGATEHGSFRSSDIDEVQAFYAQRYGMRASVEAAAGLVGGEFTARWLQAGPLHVLEYGQEPAIVLHADLHSYGAGVALSGAFTLEQASTQVATGTTTGVVHRIDAGRCAARARVAGRVRLVAIDPMILEAHLQDLVDRPVRGPIRFAPALDLSGPGASWVRLLGTLIEGLRDPDSVVRQPMVAEPLSQALLTGFLLATEHPFRDALRHPPAQRHPRAVKHALDAITACPEHPYTAATLAALTGVSVRTLQASFQRHVGASPMAYLRHVRLARAHDDLRHGRVRTVTEAAHRWGFTHLGRFAAAYQVRYCATPSETLRRA